MPFSLFRDRFRDLADRETRTITRLQDSASGLPAGQYAFVEMFCDEPGCDCRRVLFTVIDTASGRCEAVINFGWEEASFYAAWLREDDPHMVAALQGPALHLGPAQGKHANAILDFAKQLLLGDAAYVARIKRHYAMFREDVEQGNRPGPDGRSMKIGRNDPCPCGSGRKYKKCCLGIDRGPGADTKSAPIATSGALLDRVKAQVLDKSRLRITEDVDHIVEQAMARSAAIVRLGQLVLFATADGDAWLLDRGDKRALPLARAGERLPARIVENEERFTIECSHVYEVRGDLFVVEDIQSGSREVFTGYPTAELGRD